MLCPRPSTFLRQNLHIEKRRKQPQTEEALSVLEILTHLHTSFCKVTLWTLQTWSAVVPASPEPFIRLWTLFVPPIPAAPGDESKGGVSLEQGECEMQPPITGQGVMWTQAQWLWISHCWQWFKDRDLTWGSHCELVQVSVPLCIHKFFHILQKLRVHPPNT